MINRIGESGYYLHPEVKKDNHEKNDGSFEIEYDKKNKENKGVELELSSEGISDSNSYIKNNREKNIKDIDKNIEIVQEYTLFQTIKEKFDELRNTSKQLIDRLRAFFAEIWNGKEVTENIEKPESLDKVSNISIADKDITDMNMEEMVEYLSDGGKKKLAKNSNMLTTYNQYGKIVEVDPSEQNKIFHGNKPWKEL